MVLQCRFGFALIYTQGISPVSYDVLTRALAFLRENFEDFDYQQRATCGLWLFSARSGALNETLAVARGYEEIARVRDLQNSGHRRVAGRGTVILFLIIGVTHPAMTTRYGWGAVRAQA